MGLLGSENYDDLKDAHYKWVESTIQTDNIDKQNKWTQSIAKDKIYLTWQPPIIVLDHTNLKI